MSASGLRTCRAIRLGTLQAAERCLGASSSSAQPLGMHNAVLSDTVGRRPTEGLGIARVS